MNEEIEQEWPPSERRELRETDKEDAKQMREKGKETNDFGGQYSIHSIWH